MKNMPEGKALRSVVVFCLVGLYFVLAIGVTLLGSGIYRSVAASADENSTHRIALSYVANQMRRIASGPVRLGEFEGCDALRLDETLDDGSVYVTYIYCYNGQLMELYTELGSGLLPADGTALIALERLEFDLKDGLLTVTAGDQSGHSWSLTLHPEAGAEEVAAV